jgi:hypothetical protein
MAPWKPDVAKARIVQLRERAAAMREELAALESELRLEEAQLARAEGQEAVEAELHQAEERSNQADGQECLEDRVPGSILIEGLPDAPTLLGPSGMKKLVPKLKGLEELRGTGGLPQAAKMSVFERVQMFENKRQSAFEHSYSCPVSARQTPVRLRSDEMFTKVGKNGEEKPLLELEPEQEYTGMDDLRVHLRADQEVAIRNLLVRKAVLRERECMSQAVAAKMEAEMQNRWASAEAKFPELLSPKSTARRHVWSVQETTYPGYLSERSTGLRYSWTTQETSCAELTREGSAASESEGSSEEQWQRAVTM